MARQPLDPPSRLGLAISSGIRRELGDRRMSGRALAKILGKSEGYVRERLKDTYEFTLGDLDIFCQALDLDPSELINHAHVGARRDDYDLIANDTIDETRTDEEFH